MTRRGRSRISRSRRWTWARGRFSCWSRTRPSPSRWLERSARALTRTATPVWRAPTPTYLSIRTGPRSSSGSPIRKRGRVPPDRSDPWLRALDQGTRSWRFGRGARAGAPRAGHRKGRPLVRRWPLLGRYRVHRATSTGAVPRKAQGRSSCWLAVPLELCKPRATIGPLEEGVYERDSLALAARHEGEGSEGRGQVLHRVPTSPFCHTEMCFRLSLVKRSRRQ